MSMLHIRALAEEYASKYNPDNVSPFPFENVLKHHEDLKVYYTVLEDDVSGAILYKDTEYSILINTNKPTTRQNFTVGHELGHYFLHKEELQRASAIIDGDDSLDGQKILYRRDDQSNKRLEIEANNFAASLLMPADLVRRAWQATQNVEDCARIFSKVSTPLREYAASTLPTVKTHTKLAETLEDATDDAKTAADR